MFRDSYVLYIYVTNILCTFHIFMYGYGTARLEYELAYYDSAVHRFNHYTTRTPPLFVLERNKWNHLTVWKRMSSGTFKNVIYKMCPALCPTPKVYSRELSINGWKRNRHKTWWLWKSVFLFMRPVQKMNGIFCDHVSVFTDNLQESNEKFIAWPRYSH